MVGRSRDVSGTAEVRELFEIADVGTVAGCYVSDGVIERDSVARVVRDGSVVGSATVTSLRRFNKDVVEVPEGRECGLSMAGFDDFQIGDTIEHESNAKASPRQPIGPDDEDTVRDLRRAAEEGNAEGQFHLGLALLQGTFGLQRDPEEAAKWLSEAANAGLGKAQSQFGFLLERGEGVDRDVKTAYHWYVRAATAGDQGARDRLSDLASGVFGRLGCGPIDFESIGLNFLSQQEPEAALAAFNDEFRVKQQELDSSDSAFDSLLVDMGDALLAMGDREAAVKMYHSAVRRDPERATDVFDRSEGALLRDVVQYVDPQEGRGLDLVEVGSVLLNSLGHRTLTPAIHAYREAIRRDRELLEDILGTLEDMDEGVRGRVEVALTEGGNAEGSDDDSTVEEADT